jgi:hypothetical protein
MVPHATFLNIKVLFGRKFGKFFIEVLFHAYRLEQLTFHFCKRKENVNMLLLFQPITSDAKRFAFTPVSGILLRLPSGVGKGGIVCVHGLSDKIALHQSASCYG